MQEVQMPEVEVLRQRCNIKALGEVPESQLEMLPRMWLQLQQEVPQEQMRYFPSLPSRFMIFEWNTNMELVAMFLQGNSGTAREVAARTPIPGGIWCGR